MKKNKLNSSNPKFQKTEKEKNYKRVLINNVSGAKIYALYENKTSDKQG